MTLVHLSTKCLITSCPNDSHDAEEAIAEDLISKSKMSLNPKKDIPDLPNLKGESRT